MVGIRRFLACSVVVSLIPGVGLFGELLTPELECDPGLVVRTESPLAYRKRGDRCEGVYAAPVNSTQLLLVSLSESSTRFSINDPKALIVEWNEPPAEYRGGKIWLRGRALHPRSYYRLDTVKRLEAGSFRWPREILANLSRPPEFLGVLGWTYVQAADGQERELYVPLRLRQGWVEKRGEGYQVSIIPTHHLEEVYITLAPVSRGGIVGPAVMNREALGYGYYPAGLATVFSTAVLRTPGVYELEIAARLKSRGSATYRFWFLHAGDSGEGK